MVASDQVTCEELIRGLPALLDGELDALRYRKSVGNIDMDPEKYCDNVLALMRRGETMSRVVDTPTLVLYGPDDHVVDPMFVHCCEVAFTNRIGPVVVPGAGHFLQWERADILNPLLVHFFADHRSEWFA